MKVKKETNQVKLHFKELTILEASYLSSDGTTYTANEISYNFKLHVVTLIFDNKVNLSHGNLKIK